MLLPIFMTALAIAGGPAPAADRSPSREAIQQAIERSLLFLEKSAGDWKNGNNQVGADHGRPILVKGTQAACASCHHVPLTVWCMTEAKNRGFAVNDKTLDEFRHWSLTPYLKNPDLQPFAQDKFNSAKTSLNTIYLSAPLFAAQSLDEQAAEALQKFSAHLMAKQEKDGSWKSGRTGYEPPIGDSGEVLTMQAVLVLSAAAQKKLAREGWPESRDRALAWLRKNKLGDSNQSTILQIEIAQPFGKSAEVHALVKQLLKTQNADGSWSQLKDRPGDALATGQTLYRLTSTGTDPENPQIQRGQDFLMRTQSKDGSWWVPSRDKGRKGLAISHYGSGWATLGLISTLKNAK